MWDSKTRVFPRTRPRFSLLVTALCALVAANMAANDPRYLVPFALIAALLVVPQIMARRRMRRLLRSGDVERVLGSWEPSVDRVMYPETMAPLMAATAYAAYGWVEAARRALGRAVKGPAWDAALEQRLFVETLLDTFEGDRSGALAKAQALERMPLPESGWLSRRKVQMLRAGTSALARAFAHESRTDDWDALRAAGTASPLIYWAMRYAAAVVAVDQGRARDVRALLAEAPPWPEESAFRAFHDELLARS
jgi:hypothetical protein